MPKICEGCHQEYCCSLVEVGEHCPAIRNFNKTSKAPDEEHRPKLPYNYIPWDGVEGCQF